MLSIECLENSINNQLFYIGFITFKDLSESSQLKPLTVNRLTDDKRIEKMIEHIKNQESFYPPIILALEEKIEYKYDSIHKLLHIDYEKEDKPLVIIDGQHRYRSINQLVEENLDNSSVLERKQAIFIITNMNETEQRNIFMEINDNMKRVSSVSKRIFNIDIPNYVSLNTVKQLNIVKKINFKNDQCTTQYPYKFIIEGNKKLFNQLEIDKFNLSNFDEEFSKIIEISKFIWENILSYIEKHSNINIGLLEEEKDSENKKFVKTEAFINAIIIHFINKYDYKMKLKNDSIYQIEIDKLKDNFIDMINSINELNLLEIEKKLINLTKREKENKLIEILGGEINE